MQMSFRNLMCIAMSVATFIITSSFTAKDPSCNTQCNISQNTWLPRPFGSYNFQDAITLKTMVAQAESAPCSNWQGDFSATTLYMQDFGQKCNNGCKNLGARPFWSGNNSMTYGTNDGNSYIDAYQMGMGDVKTQGIIALTTRVMHIGTDLLWIGTQSMHAPGFFVKLHAPIGAMRINHKVVEKLAEPDAAKNIETNNIWLSYPSRDNRYQSALEFFQGGSTFIDGIHTIGLHSSVHKPLALEYGRLANHPNSSIRLGDLAATIGYNVYVNQKALLAVGVKAVAPTGTIPTAQYITEPIFGRGGYWGIGLETIGHCSIWKSDTKTQGLNFLASGEILHLRSGRRMNFRSFDLLGNGKGSKYLLAQFYFPANPSTDNPTGRIPSFLTHVVNLTTLPVKSQFSVEGTFMMMFDFFWKNYNLALTTQLWGRTKECLTIDRFSLIPAGAVNLNDFAILGRQVSEDAANLSSITPLYLCEPSAQINKSEDRVLEIPTDNYKIKDARLSQNRIPANYLQALDIDGAAAVSTLTYQVSLHGGYTWKELRHTPTITFIASAELSPRKSDISANLWSLGAQGSLSF